MQHLNGENSAQGIPAETVTDSITYTATDGTEQVITVSINGVNDAPVAAAAQITANENDNVLISIADLVANVTISDIDSDDSLTFNIDDIAITEYRFNSPAGFSNISPILSQDLAALFSLTDDTIMFNPGETFDFLKGSNDPLVGSDYATLNLSYAVKDSHGAVSSIENITITLNGVNDIPETQLDANNPIAELTFIEDSKQLDSFLHQGQIYAHDADDGSQLTFSLLLPEGALPVAGFSISEDGTWTFDTSTESYNYLNEGQSTVAQTVYYSVTDNFGATTTNAFNVTVLGARDTVEAQLVGSPDIEGADFDEHIIGNAMENILNGNGGDDILNGMENADTINGGLGNDVVIHRLADNINVLDTYDGGEGLDTLLLDADGFVESWLALNNLDINTIPSEVVQAFLADVEVQAVSFITDLLTPSMSASVDHQGVKIDATNFEQVDLYNSAGHYGSLDQSSNETEILNMLDGYIDTLL